MRPAHLWTVGQVGGVLLAGLAVLVTLAPPAVAQSVAWEAMPPVRRLASDPDPIKALDFIFGEGAAADDPAADSLVVFGTYGVFLYNPSGAAGAAGSNVNNFGDWGAWHPLCTRSSCSGTADGLVTSASALLIGSQRLHRATDRGRTWTYRVDDIAPFPFYESTLPALVGPTGAPGILAGASDDGRAVRSLYDGAPGTWEVVGTGFGFPQALGEVPPSPSLPGGRILYGVWNGITYSDDGGLSFTPSNAYGQAAYIAYSFAFLPVVGHPYGGVAFAGLQNVALFPGPRAEVHRSDDGGATWTLAHRFTSEETGQPETNGANIAHPALLATPDGALWSGVSLRNGSFPNRGGIMRSLDEGATWERADAGFAASDGRGFRVNQMRLGRDGRVYAATERGVWRTTGAVVAASEAPAPAAGLLLTVLPNPSSGAVAVAVDVPAAVSSVRVDVLDATGRRVATLHAGPLAAGPHRFAVDASAWAAGVYVARVETASRTHSQRFTVTR